MSTTDDVKYVDFPINIDVPIYVETVIDEANNRVYTYQINDDESRTLIRVDPRVHQLLNRQQQLLLPLQLLALLLLQLQKLKLSLKSYTCMKTTQFTSTCLFTKRQTTIQ